MKAKYMTQKLNDKTKAAVNDIKIQASILDDIIAALPECPERTAAQQRLDEAVMWAVKTAALHQYQM